MNLDVKKGEIFCLLGCNGAGKSTLFNILLGNISETSGDITYTDNINYNNNESEVSDIAYCPQHDLNWDFFTVEEHFEFLKKITESKNPQTKNGNSGIELSENMNQDIENYHDEELPSPLNNERENMQN